MSTPSIFINPINKIMNVDYSMLKNVQFKVRLVFRLLWM